MRWSKLESNYLKYRNFESEAEYKEQKEFRKIFKTNTKKLYSNLELNQISDNKTFGEL